MTDSVLPEMPNPETIPLPESGPFLVVMRLHGDTLDEADHESLRAFSAALIARVGDRATLLALTDGDGLDVLEDDDLAQLGLRRAPAPAGPHDIEPDWVPVCIECGHGVHQDDDERWVHDTPAGGSTDVRDTASTR